ncbi:14954_t:CDS:2 [Entrophospora sp. SA101]|nr:14954_t:CDS:2 [Entrophospora sp. SA101]
MHFLRLLSKHAFKLALGLKAQRDTSLLNQISEIRRDTLIPTFKNLRFQMLQA